MSRPALTPRIRDELLKLLLDQVAADRATIGIGNGQLAVARRLTHTENSLLLLTGAVFGPAAEQELGRLFEWNGRTPSGESWWLHTAVQQAEQAAEVSRAAIRSAAP